MTFYRVQHKDGTETYCFSCPGCDTVHCFNNTWTVTGVEGSWTVAPSILVTSHTGGRCHSFIRNGKIEYLGDCTHKLAGQTVTLPEYPPNMMS
jgi:hypothetical protein